jgi:hypothetical protein
VDDETRSPDVDSSEAGLPFTLGVLYVAPAESGSPPLARLGDVLVTHLSRDLSSDFDDERQYLRRRARARRLSKRRGESEEEARERRESFQPPPERPLWVDVSSASLTTGPSSNPPAPAMAMRFLRRAVVGSDSTETARSCWCGASLTDENVHVEDDLPVEHA